MDFIQKEKEKSLQLFLDHPGVVYKFKSHDNRDSTIEYREIIVRGGGEAATSRLVDGR